MDQVTNSAGIIALVEALKRVFPRITGYWTVVLAIVLGAVAGYLHVNGLDVVSGITAGLLATGVHTVASKVGGE